MNVSRPTTGVKMHQVNTKTSVKSSESSELCESSKLAKLSELSEKSLRTPSDQILNEINDSHSKYFELFQKSTPTSANITDTARIFSENSIQILATNEFD